MNTYSVAQLNQDWYDYHRLAYSIRFGQFVFNERGYEIGDSYNIGSPQEAYNLLFESLTVTLDEVFGENA